MAADKSKKHCLTNALFFAFMPDMLLLWIPRAAGISFMIAQPYLVNTTLTYIQNHDTVPVSHGYGLIAAYGIVYIGIAVRFPISPNE
jgi:ATP-binding cassette subfamily C (CFTR/MRP) protein 1